MKKNLLLVAALATAMWASAAEPVFGYMDIDALAAEAGVDALPIANPKAGTILVDNEVATLELAYDDTEMKKSGVDKNNYNTYGFNGAEGETVPAGVTGATNPTDPRDNAIPTGGWVYKLTVKKAGYITMLSALNSNKNYWVYMGLKTPVAYTLGMCVKPAEQEKWGEQIYYTVPSNSPAGTIDGNDEATKKYLAENLKNVGTKEEPVYESIGWKPQVPYLVANPEADANPGEGSGFIQFAAPRAGGVYYICAQGSKMATNGFIWTEDAFPSIAVTAKDGSQTITFGGDPAGIDNITIGAVEDENAPVYNLKGQIVDKDTKGEILIQNGKKFINL